MIPKAEEFKNPFFPTYTSPHSPLLYDEAARQGMYSRGRGGCGRGDGALESCLGDRYSCPSMSTQLHSSPKRSLAEWVLPTNIPTPAKDALPSFPRLLLVMISQG